MTTNKYLVILLSLVPVLLISQTPLNKTLFNCINDYRAYHWQFKYEYSDSLSIIAEKYASVILSNKPLMISNPNVCTATGNRLPSYKKLKENKNLSVYHFRKFVNKYFNYCYQPGILPLKDLYDVVSMYAIYTWVNSYFHSQILLNGCKTAGCYIYIDYPNSKLMGSNSSQEYPYYQVSYVAILITK